MEYAMFIKFIVILVCFLKHCYPVEQQKLFNDVSRLPNVVTQYSITPDLSFPVKNIGLLSHNFPESVDFSVLEIGDRITIYGNDFSKIFVVNEIYKFQITSGSRMFMQIGTQNHYSDFELLLKFYSDGLTLQTCIKNGENYFWGRLFIRAVSLSATMANSNAKER